MINFSEKVSFIWGVADLLRGDYKQSEYGRVILPFIVLRRLDQVLAPTREAVWQAAEKFPEATTAPALRDRMLLKAAKQGFYNISKLDFPKLLADPNNIGTNLTGFVHGFSQNVRDIMERFRFETQVAWLDNANLLVPVARKFVEVDLHPYRRNPDDSFQAGDDGKPLPNISNHEMAFILEDLTRKLWEQSNKTAGKHFTPRDVSRLVVNLLFAEDDELLHTPGIVRTLYDPACGTGGMLSVAEEHLAMLNPEARLKVYGQELDQESYAICKAGMLVKGQDSGNVKCGNPFSEDGLPDLKADYLVSNPPFGVDWSKAEKVVRAEHESRGFSGRFGPGLPRRSDGSLLFLLHMISKMKPVAADGGGGSRLAIVFNGSPLFTGAAASGESEIRRWIIENDWLEAIVGLPDQLFHSTGISTYIWLVTNRKTPERQGKIQVIDGVSYFQKMRKALGGKRKALGLDHIAELTRLYADFGAEHPDVRVFDNADFGFHRITVERPLKLNFQASVERIARLDYERAWQDLLKSKKKGDKAQAEITEGQVLQEAVLSVLEAMDGTVLYKARPAFVKALKAAAKAQDVKIPTTVQKAVLSALSERDETAQVCMKKGEPEPDPDLRDYENVPLKEDIQEYMAREVLPHVPDAWADESKIKMGYSIDLLRHLGFRLQRELDSFAQQYQDVHLVLLKRLCVGPLRRQGSPQELDPVFEGVQDAIARAGVRGVRINPDTGRLLPGFLKMFFATELAGRLLNQMTGHSPLPWVPTEALGNLQIPFPSLPEQRSLLRAWGRIDEVKAALRLVERGLAANPNNVEPVERALVPALKALKLMGDADVVRDLASGGETRVVEFKQTYAMDLRSGEKREKNERAVFKTIAAFLNSDGGDLLVGVTDGGRPFGLNQEIARFHGKKPDKFMLHFKNRLAAWLGAEFYPLVDQKLVSVDEHLVLWVRCRPSDEPVFLQGRDFFVRTYPATDLIEGPRLLAYINRRFGDWGVGL